jgi:hypothetical protein
MATPYTPLTDAEKLVSEPRSIFPSGEAHFFDSDVQGLVQGTKKFVSPTDDGTFVDSSVNNLIESKPETALHPGAINNSNDTTVKNSLLKPNGLLFDGAVDNNSVNHLSNAQEHVYTGFTLINPYIHYTPAPDGGEGLMDKTPFFFNYNPLYGTTSEKYYRYGKPS